MGKNIKSYATTQQSISSWEREGSLTEKKSPNLSAKNIVWLNHTHLFLHPLTSKIFKFKVCFLANFQQIIQILRNSPQNPVSDVKFALFIDPLYIIAFQIPDHWQRTL